jgi:hypothetical protein
MAYGRTTLTNNSVFPTRVSADGSPQYKSGGGTVDWTTVSSLGSDTTDPDGSIVRSGLKRLRYGQVMTKITGDTNTATISGTPTGGTFTLTVTNPYGDAQTTGTIAYNAAASAVQTALTALSNVGSGNATATGSAGGPYTITFASILGTMSVALGTNSLTGGTSPTVTIGASIASGNTRGYFGPYDPNATDGRQNLNRGDCFILDETILQYSTGASTLGPSNDQIGSLIDGGDVFIDRVLHAGTGTHTLAAGPTLAEVLAAFPLLKITRN